MNWKLAKIWKTLNKHFLPFISKKFLINLYHNLYSIENYKNHIRFLYANQQSSKRVSKRKKRKRERKREREKEDEAKKKKKNVDNFERRSCKTRRNETGVAEGQCQISDTVDNPVQTKH